MVKFPSGCAEAVCGRAASSAASATITAKRLIGAPRVRRWPAPPAAGRTPERGGEFHPSALPFAQRHRNHPRVVEKPRVMGAERPSAVRCRPGLHKPSVLEERPGEDVLAVDVGPQGLGRTCDLERIGQVAVVVEREERELAVIEATIEWG